MKPLVAVTRNNYIESIHYGLICVVNSNGRVLHHIGDIKTKIFFRSCAKPLQTLPVIQSGAAKTFGFSLKDIALACGSHTGQSFHRETVASVLKKIGLTEKSLHCGIKAPYNKDENIRLLSKGLSPSLLHCTCSGKHAAMLALSKYRNYPLNGYEKITHPVQNEILNTIAYFAGEDAGSIPTGIDGCGVPIYLLPIYKTALSYAKMMHYSQDSQSAWHEACKTVYHAMTQYPEMVAGEGEFCTELMQAAKGNVIAKIGGEGVYCVGVKEGNLGICIKIADGNERGIYPAVIKVLSDLNILDNDSLAKLESWYNPAIINNHGEKIGEIMPVFHLKKSATDSHNLGDFV